MRTVLGSIGTGEYKNSNTDSKSQEETTSFLQK
jgi:hypothetical protein